MGLRILVAINPEGDRRLAAILHGHELIFVRTLDEAQAVLAAQPFDLAAIGTRFDESRMFDLLRHIRSREKTRGIGVVCFRGILFRRPGDKVLVEGLSLGCQALGAEFHDFIGYPDDEAGNREIRRIFESCATADKGPG
jgi:hypothetical protein